MRVALISDIHGNALALRAVLADIDRAGVDEIVCLGDVATLGPQPRAVIRILRERGCACVMGNHDEFLLDPAQVREYSGEAAVIESVAWCRATLAQEDLDFVRSFARTLRIRLDRHSSLLAFHGTPGSNTTDLLATTDDDAVDALLAGHEATVMAAGHTHVQMLRQHRGTLLVNPGSVGLPFREHVGGRPPALLPHAEYAIVEAAGGRVGVALHRVPLDPGRLRAAAQASDVPLRDYLLTQYP